MKILRLFRVSEYAAPLGLLLLLSACSGGNGSSGNSTAPASNNSAPKNFTDVTLAAGLDYSQAIRGADLGSGPAYFTGGAAVGDYDADGWVDLYVTRFDNFDILYRNLGNGSFEDVTASTGIERGHFSNGAGWADIDNDGDLDLYVTTVDSVNSRRGYLYINQGDGTFVEDAENRGAAAFTFNGQSVGFGDFDRDGWLDMIVDEWDFIRSRAHSQLLKNNAGSFSDANDLIDMDGLRAFTSAFVDMNNDMWPDLAITADYGDSRYFVNNRGQGFSLAAGGYMTSGPANDMGAALADYDHDGDIDWIATGITKTGGNNFYVNNGDDTFSERAVDFGIDDSGWGWGAAFIDFDNDADLDLVTTAGVDIPAKHAQGILNPGELDDYNNDPLRFWLNDQGNFVESSVSLGTNDRRQGKALVTLDYDRDGDLDIFVVNNS
ncbi:MAG: VCBS repeat-containing protein, partial [Gammaproteobacteria bacterium]|nr:VCBS repeat-containing protein [Gammaproteobacteria bacterium]